MSDLKAISHHTALIYTMVIMSASDGAMSEKELPIISELSKTLVEARVALKNIDNAAGQLNKLIGDSKGPVKSFTETGYARLLEASRM